MEQLHSETAAGSWAMLLLPLPRRPCGASDGSVSAEEQAAVIAPAVCHFLVSSLVQLALYIAVVAG